MGKTALIFTGQGSQQQGMGKDFYEQFPCAKDIFDTFDNVTGKKISEISFTGSDEELKLTCNSQPCILAVELAILESFKLQTNIKPDFVAGHSLGEYAALYAANVISLEDTIKLIQARANAMSKINKGMMSAIIGLPEENLKEILKKVNEGYVDIANYNTPEQIVITGEIPAVNKANELCLSNGAKRAIPLAVSGAFHSKLMKPASEEFAKTAEAIKLSDANIPVITNVDAIPTINAEEFRNKMISQIYSSVHWVQTLNYMYEQGVDNYIEIGPSRVLTGMVRKTLKDVKFSAITNIDDLNKITNELTGV